jgi:tetratricopeptide (TPR) repeat protein
MSLPHLRNARRCCLPVLLARAAACAAGPRAAPGPGGAPAAQSRPGPADLAAAERDLGSRARDPSLDPAARAAAWARLGVARGQAERWEDAAAAFESSLALAPDRPRVLFDLGVAYRRLGRYAEARDAYRKAAAVAPGDLDIAYNLGILYELYLNQPDQALAAYTRYVDGQGPEAERVRGWIQAIRRRESGPGGTVP